MKRLVLLMFVVLAGCGQESDLLQQAIELSQQSKFDEAKMAYEELLEMDSDNPLYRNNYGWVLLKLGEYTEAREHLEFAAKHEDKLEGAPRKNLAELASLEQSN